MKIRMLNNSIRFRLKEPEVKLFRQTGSITEALEFGAAAEDQLRFTLQAVPDASLSASFQHNAVTIYVPLATAEKWTGSDMIGFDGSIDTAKGKIIRVLVEKDFKCLDGREEDNEGAYPNPQVVC